MKTYKEIFGNNTEEALVNAVRNGMNVYLRNHCMNYHNRFPDNEKYETFFEAAVRYGTPALVNACIDMGADVNCIAPIRARSISPRAVTSSLFAAMRAYNPETLRTLLERGAKTGVLNNLCWDIQRNVFPEAANDESTKEIKQRLDSGSEILKILRDAGFRVPGLDRNDDKMSFFYVSLLFCSGSDEKKDEEIAGEKYTAWDNWDENYVDGGDDYEKGFDRYCEGLDEYAGEYSFPCHGTRPGALWHAASPEALRLMIESGADIHARDAAGWTALHHIAFQKDDYYFNPDVMLQILVDSGADINARGRYGMTPLMLAGLSLYLHHLRAAEVIKLLLRNGADPYAIDNGNRDFYYWMLGFWSGSGQYRNFIFKEILFELYSSVQLDKAKKEKERNGSIPVAVEKDGRALMADDLQKLGLTPWRSFREIFAFNSAGTIAYAVKNGLNLSLKDADGEDFLDAALRYGTVEVVQACVDRGINVNASGRGTIAYPKAYPLYKAIKACNADAVETLLKAGADPKIAEKLDWRERINIFPEGSKENEEAKEFKRRLDSGAKILKLLRKAGANVPSADDLELTYTGAGYNEFDSYRSGKAHILTRNISIKIGNRTNAKKVGYAITRLLQDAGYDTNGMNFVTDCKAGEDVYWIARSIADTLTFTYHIAARSLEAGIAKILQAAGGGKEIESNVSSATFTGLPAITALRYAASPEALKLLIISGVDVNARGPGGCTAMHLVARDWPEYFNPDAMLKILIDAGADVNARDDNGVTPLMLLAGNIDSHIRALKAVKYLLAAGADSEVTDAKERCVYKWMEKKDSDKAQWGMGKKDPGSALRNLLGKELFDAIVETFDPKNQKDDYAFVQKKADVNLLMAACWGSLAEIESELSRGADVNARSENGYTPLMFASVFNTKEAVRFLIGKGAEADARNKREETALILASLSGRSDTDVIRALIEAGADVNARNAEGNSSLFMTAHACVNDEVAIILIQAGADVDVKNENGDTALKQAIEQIHFKVAKTLLVAGADPEGIFPERKLYTFSNNKDDDKATACLRQFGLKV